MTIIKSISFSQQEILQNIIDLHTGSIECDVTYGAGVFYKNLPRPALCFDLEPRPGHPQVIQADVCHLPLENAAVRTVMFDPPFMARTGPGAALKRRFGELVGTIKDLWNFYFRALREIHRVLIPGGWLVMKCQDGVLSGKNNFTHAEIYAMGKTLGFVPKDLFILLAKNRMMHPKHQRQVHARKYHSYFWVLQKMGVAKKKTDMSRPYLISAEHFDFARHEARERRIPPNQWKYIPWQPELDRKCRLAGHRGFSKENLIGRFSEEERARLMRPL
jgi:hypothetical protein